MRSEGTAAGPLLGLPILAVVAAAAVGLPLFQDGSSYLLELLLTGSAIRHHRVSALPFQLPAMVVARGLAAVGIPGDLRVTATRLAFNLSYAAVPVLALALSWWVVRRDRPELLIWPALIVLFVNLVDFSWVSELLIAMQLACPLLLIVVVAPGARRFAIVTALLLPVVWVLHPLSALLLAAIAAAAWLQIPRPEVAVAARRSAALYALAALVRAWVGATASTPYERSFAGGEALVGYLFAARWESMLFLSAALTIAVVCWRARSLGTSTQTLPRLYAGCMALAAAAAVLLISQYFAGPRAFPLKAGVAVITAVLVMAVAGLDARVPALPAERRERLRLARVLAAVFAMVIGVKAMVWHQAVGRVASTMAASDRRCVEIADEFTWLSRPPNAIVDNWALPSLALVSLPSESPRKWLLQPGDCVQFFASGMVQVDPWTSLPAPFIDAALAGRRSSLP